MKRNETVKALVIKYDNVLMYCPSSVLFSVSVQEKDKKHLLSVHFKSIDTVDLEIPANEATTTSKLAVLMLLKDVVL